MSIVRVAVGVVVRGNDIFVSLRPDHVHQGGKWEFPGGKVEQSETVESALARELKEEIDIDVISSQPLIVINHDYGDKQVSLEVRVVDQFNGQPHGREGQQTRWVAIGDLDPKDFPEANVAIIHALRTFYQG